MYYLLLIPILFMLSAEAFADSRGASWDSDTTQRRALKLCK